MRRYAIHSGLVEVAVDLLGPEVRLYWDQAVSKPPGATSDVPWHQDNGYTPVEPEEYVTFTVAIDETSEQNGCLWIQPGSHRSGVQPHRPTDMIFFRGYDGPDTGVAAPHDHPHIYLDMGGTDSAICPYCATRFRYNADLGSGAIPADSVFEGGMLASSRRQQEPLGMTGLLPTPDNAPSNVPSGWPPDCKDNAAR